MDLTPDYNAAPRNFHFSLPKFHDSMERCFECATSAWISADAFISERDEASLALAIEACLNCAEVCARTMKVLVAHSHHTDDEIRAQLAECIAACKTCAKEAAKHCDQHEHCWICVKCCEECLRVCESEMNEL